jgi:4'-phosphopantetheinyl transferase
MENVNLYIVNIDLARKHRSFLLKNINEEQKQIASSFKQEADQDRSIISSYLKNVLSKETLSINNNGKPFFENGPYFNISHSGHYIVMAVSTSEVGIDIEENKNRDMSSLTRIFNEAEAKVIKEHQDFYYLWCAKESLIKCMGSTIGTVKEIPSLPLNGLKTFKGKDYQCHAFIFDNHIISITREGKEEYEVKTIKVEHLPLKIK